VDAAVLAVAVVQGERLFLKSGARFVAKNPASRGRRGGVNVAVGARGVVVVAV
jgi:hypothetical protein